MTKRLLDMTLSGAGLLASAPLWVVIAALIKIEDRGPVFFTQERVGQGVRRFEALKFRSLVAEGKEVKTFDGEEYILERGIRSDISIIKGWKADESGNLIFRKTARNFNPLCAMSGKVTVAEVEELVEPGEQVVAIGSPLGLQGNRAESAASSATTDRSSGSSDSQASKSGSFGVFARGLSCGSEPGKAPRATAGFTPM